MRPTGRSGLLSLLALPLSTQATAEPLDLLDPTPRPVEVAFEVSPRDRPTQTDTIYTPKLLARLEPAEEPGRIRVTVDRGEVEAVLLADDDPVPGSFSDFVWTFDAVSGEVLSATLSGTLRKRLDWGLFDSTAEAFIEVNMETQRVAGVEQPRRWLGQQLFGYCDQPSTRSCERVAGRSYDPERGYVYAVGLLRVHFGNLTLRTFSPLGEAVFAEIEGTRDGIGSVVEGVHQARAGLGAIASSEPNALPTVSAGPPAN